MPRLPGKNRCIEIEYADADGVVSQRKVNVSLFYRPESAPMWYVEGFCGLRGDQRTFRTDRMLRLWDGRDGWSQVADPTAWVEALWSSQYQPQNEAPQLRREFPREPVEHGISKWGRHSILGNTWGASQKESAESSRSPHQGDKSILLMMGEEMLRNDREIAAQEKSAASIYHPHQGGKSVLLMMGEEMLRQDRAIAAQLNREKFEEEVHSIINQHFHALRALIYVAKADKAYRAAERRLFNLFFTRTAGHRMDTNALRERCMVEAARIDPPTTGQFYYSVRQLIPRTKKYRMAICATAKAMINSDKTVASYEIKVFDYLVRKLKPLDD